MNENINKEELNRLAQIGSSDASQEVNPKSIATSIAASILYCTSPIIETITLISGAAVGASVLFSCTNNPAQCG